MKHFAGPRRCRVHIFSSDLLFRSPSLLYPNLTTRCPEIETPLSPLTAQTDRLTAPARSMTAAAQGHARTLALIRTRRGLLPDL